MPKRKQGDIPSPDNYLTSGELSRLLGVHQRTLNRYALMKRVPFRSTLAGVRLYSPRAVADAYTKAGEQVPSDLARFIAGEPVLALPAADVRRVPTEQLRAELARREERGAA